MGKWIHHKVLLQTSLALQLWREKMCDIRVKGDLAFTPDFVSQYKISNDSKSDKKD